jgi:hypothetical protein
MTSSWRCFRCDEVTKIVGRGTGRYTFAMIRGKVQPVHFSGECLVLPPKRKIRVRRLSNEEAIG